MFEKQLEEAARKSRLQIILLSIGILVAALIAAAFLLLQTLNNAEQYLSADQEPIAESVEPSTQEPSLQVQNPEQLKPETGEIGEQAEKPVREQGEVLDLLSRYDKDMEKTILSDPFGSWDPPLQDDIVSTKKAVIDHMARGEIDDAFDRANQLLEKASVALSQFDLAFEKAVKSASVALKADNLEEAQAASQQALTLKPESEKAQQLRESVARLEQVLPIIEKARVAAVENNLPLERELSNQIYSQDPSRTFYRDRAAEISRLLEERDYEKVIVAGLAAAKKEDLKSLKRAVETAQSLYPNREETKELLGKFLWLQQELQYREFVAQADAAVRSENWEGALFAFQNALQLKPNEGTIAQGVELARTVLDHESKLGSYLSKPERLTNQQVKSEAEVALKDAETYVGLSKKLAAAATTLKNRIVDYNRLVDIWVVSDKTTQVSVRGVGQVGQVDKYKIQLKPGRYILEGRREGYRVKAVELTVTPDDRSIDVKVICDERI